MKNRLVGILVLLLIGVVAWSLLFDNDIDRPVDTTSRIAELPKSLESYDVSTPENDLFDEQNIENAQAAMQTQQSSIPLDSAKKTPSYAKPKSSPEFEANAARGDLDTAGGAISWRLQLASFVERERADKLVSQLQDKGYRAYLQGRETSKGLRYRVYVGPSLDQAQLKQLKAKIDKQFKVESILQRFSPE